MKSRSFATRRGSVSPEAFRISALLLLVLVAALPAGAAGTRTAAARPAVPAGRPADTAGRPADTAGRPADTAARPADGEETFPFGRFGTVTLYHRSPHPSQVVLFVSGDGGWNQGVVDMARELASLDALVAGIDITHYLKELAASSERCSYPASDFEDLSKYVQKRLGYPTYVTPVLVGYSSGATLVYAILVQAPSNTFRGAISLGFCPDLLVNKPFCPGNGLHGRPGPKGKGIVFLPATTLEVPWIALQGTIDQVCYPDSTVRFVKEVPNGQVVVLPKVGHGYSVPRNWLPQFKDAFASIVASKPIDAPMVREDELQDLPLTEVPAAANPLAGVAGAPESDSAAASVHRASQEEPAGPSRDAIVIHVTGDGGWGVTDKGIGRALAEHGLPVVALNSLHYFWHAKTPDQAAQDLARIMSHYLAVWHARKVVLIGYSFGAEVVPFMYNRLPDDLREKVALVALLGPSAHASFQFHLSDWLGGDEEDEYAVAPEIEKIAGPRILCFYGEEDTDVACRNLDPGRVTSIAYGGGHRVGGRYDEIATRILEAVQ